jgi:hypothetical protein
MNVYNSAVMFICVWNPCSLRAQLGRYDLGKTRHVKALSVPHSVANPHHFPASIMSSHLI